MGKWAGGGVKLEPIEFDGDSITFTVNRLKVSDMAPLAKHFQADGAMLTFSSQLEVCSVAAETLPRYVLTVEGMTKADGSAMTKDEFCAALPDFYFAELLGTLLTRLIEASTPGRAEKN